MKKHNLVSSFWKKIFSFFLLPRWKNPAGREKATGEQMGLLGIGFQKMEDNSSSNAETKTAKIAGKRQISVRLSD